MIVLHEKIPLKYLRVHADPIGGYCRWNDPIDEQTSYRAPLDQSYRANNGLSLKSRFNAPLFLRYKTTDSLKNLASAFSDQETEETEIGEEEMIQLSTLNNNQIINGYKNKIANYGINKLKTTFGETIKMHFDVTTYRKFLCWLKKYDKYFYKHITKVTYKPYYILRDSDFIINLGDYTFARIMTGTGIKNELDSIEKFRYHIAELDVNIYVFGKNVKKACCSIERLREGQKGLISYIVNVNKLNERSNIEIYRDVSASRSKESVFLNDHIKEELLSFVHKFFSNKSIYDKRNLHYKTGILLYGEPGTGKSTIANMIATESNCNMVLINMNSFKDLDTDSLTSTLNADDETYIVVLEDIDCVIGNRDYENEDLENKKNVNKLLQFLDSNSSPNNVIFVATTNHIEKLDQAILRDGRFDLMLNITNIDEPTAAKMCRSFGIKDDKVIKRIFKENSVDGRINPAKLQNLILKEIGA